MVIKGMLAKLGIDPVIARTGNEAVQLFRKTQFQVDDQEAEFDLILMDCEMPEMDGFQATEQIRAIEKERRCSPIPIVALTAHAMIEQKNQAKKSGMDDYLTKPLGIEKLSQTLQKYCNPPHMKENTSKLARGLS